MEKMIQDRGEKSVRTIVGICEAAISLCIFLVFFSLPLFFLNLTFQGIIFEKQIFFYLLTFLAIVAWTIKSVVLGELKIKKTPLDIPIVIFWFLYLLAAIFSVDRWHSFFGFFGDPSRGFFNVSVVILFYYLIFNTFNFRRAAMALVGLVFSGVIFSIWTLLMVLGVKFLPASWLSASPIILSGTVSSAGLVLSVMIMIFITFIFLIQDSEDTGRMFKNFLTFFSLAGLIVDLFLMLVLYNFIPWKGLLIGFGVFLIFIISRIVQPKKNWIWLPMVVFVAIMGILMVGPMKISRVNLPIEVNPSFKISMDIAKEAIKKDFFLGSGPGTYGYDFSLYRPVDFNNNYFYNLRFYQGTGAMAEGIATLGILGITSFLLLLATYLGVSFYYLNQERRRNKIFSLGLISSSLVVLFYAFTGQTSGMIIIWGAGIISLSLATIISESSSHEKALVLSLKASPKYALLVAFIFVVVSISLIYIFIFLGKVFVADLYVGSAARQEKPDEENSVSKLIKAINLYPKEGRYYTRTGQEYMLLANIEMSKLEKERDLNKIKNYLNNAVAAGKKGKELMKNDVLAMESLGKIYENSAGFVENSLDEAENAFKEAQKLEPHNPNYFLELGKIKITRASMSKDENEKKKLVNESKDLLGQSLKEKNDFHQGYYQMALVEEDLGNIDSAIENMNRAFRLKNSNINYAFNLARLHQRRGGDNDNKIAEDLFKQILKLNEKEISTHFSLGLLYEKTKRSGEAINEYKKIIEILSEISNNDKRIDTVKSRDQIQKMINNIQNGGSNLSQNTENNISNQVIEQPVESEQSQ